MARERLETVCRTSGRIPKVSGDRVVGQTSFPSHKPNLGRWGEGSFGDTVETKPKNRVPAGDIVECQTKS